MYFDDASGLCSIGVDAVHVRLNEGYKPRAPQVGDLVKCLGEKRFWSSEGTGVTCRGYGVVLDKSGLNIKVLWFSRGVALWATRTSVAIKNRSVKCK